MSSDVSQSIVPRSATRRLAVYLPLILGALIAIGLLTLARRHLSASLGEAAFGRETQNTLSTGSKERNHCLDSTDSPRCLSSWEAAGRPPTVLWLGNSQLAGINRYKPGDQTASDILHARMKQRGYYLLTYSQPNANLMEHALVFSAVTAKVDARLLILPVFLDDIREQGVREFVRAFLNDPEMKKGFEQSRAASLVASQLTEPGAGGGESTVERSFMRRFEDAFDARLSEIFPLWRDRGVLRGNLAYGIHHYRNQLLGINAQSKRKVDASVYREKLAVLDMILAQARAQGCRVLLYVPPFRKDIAGPYVAEDYARLKQDMAALADRYGARYADIDGVVPGSEWATVVDVVFGSEDYDFMHFTADGHRRHADALDVVLKSMGF